MGIGAALTLLFVAAFFSTMFWLIARMPGGSASETPPANTSDAVAG